MGENSTYLIGLLWSLNKLTFKKYLEEHLAQHKHHVSVYWTDLLTRPESQVPITTPLDHSDRVGGTAAVGQRGSGSRGHKWLRFSRELEWRELDEADG